MRSFSNCAALLSGDLRVHRVIFATLIFLKNKLLASIADGRFAFGN